MNFLRTEGTLQRRLIRLIFAGWLPPVLGASRSGLNLASRVSLKRRLIVSSRILLTGPFCPVSIYMSKVLCLVLRR